MEGRQLLKDGKPPAAEKLTRDYVAQNVTSPNGHYLPGELLCLEKKTRESLGEFTEAAKSRTPSATAFVIVAADYVVLADYRGVDKWFSKVIASGAPEC